MHTMQLSKSPSMHAPALTLFPTLKPPNKTLTFHQISIFLLTFSAYASFHASRKPPSIVKSVLGSDPDIVDTGWPPFDGPRGTHRLGELDLAFLASYSIGMYFSGHFGDRIDLRLFLAFGMFGSGVLTVAFGLGFWLKVHVLGYFLVVQIACGLFQSIGWPCVVAVVGNWFGKSKRGLIMGVWNSNTSVGNVIGSVMASAVLEFGWGWSFLLPGLLIILVGILVFGFLVVKPEDIGLQLPENGTEMNVELGFAEDSERVDSEEARLLRSENLESSLQSHNLDSLHQSENLDSPLHSESLDSPRQSQNVDSSPESLNLDTSLQSKNLDSLAAIGFLEAWSLPSVAPFAFCLFFSKLVAYTFLYWLPFYIRHTAVAGVQLSHKTAGILSTIFDVGGVFGGIMAGYISDKIEARAVTAFIFLLLSIPSLVFYRIFGSVSMLMNIGLMFLCGLLVNGPYSLITTAVATDLGTQSFNGNSRALATVTAIIDGTGSVGAALGPLIAGYVSTRGWNSVFLVLVLSLFLASLFLIRIAQKEIKGKLTKENGINPM